MALGDKDIDEAKLAGIVEDYLSDVRFDKFNFAWHMGNKSPRVQEEFWELLWAWIQEMAQAYERNLVDTKHFAVAQACHRVYEYMTGKVDNQLEFDF